METGLQFGQLAVDAENAARLAGFWAGLVGRDVEDGANECFARVPASDDGNSPSMIFLKVPEPRTTKNRWYIDLFSTDPQAEVQRAIALGATHVGDFDEYGTTWTTLTDPEGNVFDIGAAH